MRRTGVDRVVAEMKAELTILDGCMADYAGHEVNAADIISSRRDVLAKCIARLSGNGTEAPKVTRTRKSRKATEPSL